MKIAILGGTGDIGQGLALRWAHDTDHTIRIGSRSADKAMSAADEYRETLADRGVDADIEGHENAIVTEGADLVVLAAPPVHIAHLAEDVAGALSTDAVLVSPAVALHREEWGFAYEQPDAGSFCHQVVEKAPPENPVIGAFHNLSAKRLSALDADLELDTLVVGDDSTAKEKVVDLASEIEGLRGLDAGPLTNAATVESMTPLCITVAVNNDGLHDLGLKFV